MLTIIIAIIIALLFFHWGLPLIVLGIGKIVLSICEKKPKELRNKQKRSKGETKE